MPRKRTTRKYTRRVALRPKSDKFIVGMVKPDGSLVMFNHPQVATSYKEAVEDAHKRYEKWPTNKFVVFAKVCTIGAPRLAPKVEEWSF